MRAAENTAKWNCDATGMRCKWTYDTVVLAESENCQDPSAGNNHKDLAAEARVKAQSLKEEKEEYDQLVAELTIKMEDAENRAK